MDFNLFKAAVAAQWQRMQVHPMLRVEVDKDLLWQTYLESFPEGSNPLFRERSEHDCSCCRHFIRSAGDAVAVISGAMVSAWDIRPTGEPAYDAVAAAMSALALSAPIAGPFLHFEASAGTDRSFEQITDPEPGVRTWTHFHVNLDRRLVKPGVEIPTALSAARSTHDVFLRSLREITPDAVETVLDLIGQGSLYRGEEHRATVLAFKTAQQKFATLDGERAQDIFAWTADASDPVSRIRNTAIGTLLVDLSEGVDLEGAVRSFESKVAPTNYQRPTALVTPAMIKKAKETVAELGLTSALERRFAQLRDLSVADLLFVDRAAKKALAGDVFDELADGAAVNLKSLDRVEEVPVERFIAEILPRAESIEVMVENRHAGNLVSLIAPVDPTARRLFKWPNGFSWSYAGEVADSIKERVKAAGGSVTGDLCCRLAWSNFDDLDLHMAEPGGFHIYYADKASPKTGGSLDVDMNAGSGTTRSPVENIFYGERSKMREGVYHLYVRQFCARETTNVGFEVEIDFLGTVHRFAYAQPVRGDVTVAKFRYSHKSGLEIVESLPATLAQREVWGLRTQSFVRVNAMLLSPNFWGDRPVGNKHYLFMLDGCRNDGSARGFFNEFLSEDLSAHRKVFEVVGAKMKPADSPEQLSGLGFSSTQRNTLICRVRGSFTRTIKIAF